jgi:hypothetical protein
MIVQIHNSCSICKPSDSPTIWLCHAHWLMLRRPQLYCKYCRDQVAEAVASGRNHSEGPRHEASPRCESGKHPHCSCDTCF